MILKDLLEKAGYPCPPALRMATQEITGITSDSRTVQKGNVFVALRGLRQDGSCFVGDAMARGAVFAVSERCVASDDTLTVSDARVALARLTDAWYGHPAKNLELIGITGTNGKTSTATMLHAILRHAGYSCGLIGTVECRLNDRVLTAPNQNRLANMTTPDPAQLYALLAQMRDGGAQYVVMEVTSHALAFSKTAPLQFKRAVFTNLTPDHLDLHGDMESYFAEKSKLFDACQGAVIAASAPYGQRLADRMEVPLWRVDEVSVRHVQKHGAKGVSFSLYCPPTPPIAVQIPVPGDFTVENGALAAMTALSLGVESNRVQEALLRFTGVKGRMERVGENPFGFSVFLDYAHTPDALEKLLRTVRDFQGEQGRILLLFGCGGDRDRTKRAVMGEIAARLADQVIITSDNARGEDPIKIICQIASGIPQNKAYTVIPDRAEAIRYAIQNAKAGDLILLAGKGHEEYEIVGGERRPFSEGWLVKEAFRARLRAQNGEDKNEGEPTV